MKKKFLLFVIAFCFLIFFEVGVKADGSAYYTTYATYTENEIEVSDTVLKNVKQYTELHNDEFAYGSLIRNEYVMHIYHYKASRTGFFSAYTTGTSDTIIKIYREKKIFGFTTGFEDLGKSDDGCLVSYDKNGLLTLRLNNGDDYYICVRMKSNSKGYYNIFIGPNLDKMSTNFYNYREWNVKEHAILDEKIHRKCDYKKLYLSKEQVILFYWALCSDDPNMSKVIDSEGNVITLNDLYRAYNENVDSAISLFNTIASVVCSFSPNPLVGITETMLGLILQYAYKGDTKTKDEMKQILIEKCGAEVVPVSQYWKNGEFYETKKYSVKKELCVIYRKIASSNDLAQPDFKTILYEGYDNEVKEGYKYDKGEWSC